MLKLSCERAEIKDGHSILELGCGWGSLTCYMAKNFPKSKITAVSNSKDQKLFIENRCKKDGLHNISVITADMNDFTIDSEHDRVVSIEMFEHMRNYKKLLEKVSSFLKKDGKLLFIFFLMSFLFIHLKTIMKVIGWLESFLAEV